MDQHGRVSTVATRKVRARHPTIPPTRPRVTRFINGNTTDQELRDFTPVSDFKSHLTC